MWLIPALEARLTPPTADTAARNPPAFVILCTKHVDGGRDMTFPRTMGKPSLTNAAKVNDTSR